MNHVSIHRPSPKDTPASEFERRHFPYLTGTAKASVFRTTRKS